MELLKLVLTLSLALGLSTFVFGQQREATFYGETCSIYNPCVPTDKLDPLLCSTDQAYGVCICDVHMFRHPTLNRCVSPPGMTCTISSNDGLPSRTCTEFAQCWPRVGGGGGSVNETDPEYHDPDHNPIIGSGRLNGTCICDGDAVPDPVTGYCRLKYGSSRCKVDTDCDVLSSLTCREGECVCQDEEFQVYDKADGKCKALVGGSCVSEPPFADPECLGPHMICDKEGSGKCVCNHGFTSNPDKTCGRRFLESCDPEAPSSDCHSHFVCHETEKTCTCPDDLGHHNGTCRILAGGDCTDSELSCVEHAQCQNGVCTCSSPDFKMGKDKRCVATYGATCDNQTMPCSENDFLICGDEGTCTCKEKYESDDAQRLCRGVMGQSCRSGRDEDCVGNLVCNSNGGNICACPDRYEASGEDHCVGLYGASCSSTGGGSCSSTRSLTCDPITNICECSDPLTHLYEVGKDKCLVKAGTECLDTVSGGVVECVSNATCSNTDPMTCGCFPSYIATDEGRCTLFVGSRGGADSVVACSSFLAFLTIVASITIW